MSSIAVGAPKRWTSQDVVNVACLKQTVTLEDGCLDRLPKGSEQAPEYTAVDLIPCEDESTAFSADVCRAGIFCRVISLLQGRPSVRPAIVQFLVAMLNANVIPVLTSNLIAGEELVAIIAGRGQCRNGNGALVPTADALAAAKLTAVSVKVTDANALIGHPFISIGASCLLAAGASNLLKVIDSVAALGCELNCAKAEAFDAIQFEVNRAHRGQILSASNIRLLVEGSKRLNSAAAAGATAAPVAELHNAPQIHGPCHETIAAAAKAIEIELNSSEGSALDFNAGISFNPCQSVVNISSISVALEQLLKTSQMRQISYAAAAAAAASPSSFEVANSSSSTGNNTSNIIVSDISAATYSKLNSLVETLGLELAVIIKGLDALDGGNSAAAGEAVVAAAAASAPPVAAMAAMKVSQDDSKLTPEQLAKVEAKRKAKAEKDAAKAAAKAAKKAGANKIVLGAGCTQLRNFISDRTSGSGDTATAADETKIAKLIDPFDFSENSFAFFCSTVLEQLNAGGKRRPKIAKGTRDYGPEQMRIREQAFTAIRRVFKRHGAVEIDTPVFELKEVLTGKYGEDSKLIYDLADQGGELLSLRYDLTVPFARFLAMNSVGNIKRFHIARVYRRDQPQLNRGRYREFYQCDFDIAGSYTPMVPDAEVISCVVEILRELPVGDFMVKLNHRKLLDAIFDICGVPMAKFRPICSAVDKLDKMSWEEVKCEMVEEKGLDPAVADKIGQFVNRSGEPKAMWNTLMELNLFGDHAGASEAMKDLKILFDFLEAMGSLSNVSFDLSLARGLDYYTGSIYEAVLLDGTSQVGSIAAGGRYDNLVGMFSPSGTQTPCVGVSVGIERVFTIMEKRAEQLQLLQAATVQVYIASIGANLTMERMKVARMLWHANISAEYSHAENPKLKRQLDETLEKGIPFMVVFGNDEIENRKLKLKNMLLHTEIEVDYDCLVSALLAQNCIPVGGEADGAFLKALKGEPEALAKMGALEK